MKSRSFIITGALVAAIAMCTPMAAFAQGAKKNTDAAASASPAESASSTTATSTDKPARPIPFHGVASAVDQNAKTFTIAGKTSSRVFKATDQTTVTKGGASASFSDLTADEKVSGSYFKQADGTLELKSLKIGGAEGGGSSKKAKKDDASAEASPAAKK